MSHSFQNQTGVVTGAGSGIGRQLVHSLLSEGMTIHALDRSEERLAELSAEHPDSTRLHTHCVDITDRAELAAVSQKIHEQENQIDLLVNNAGVTLLEETHEATFEDWKQLLDVNFMGAVYCIHQFYPKMVARRSGQIANITSVAGHAGYCTAAAYATSKAALIGFSRSLTPEARAHGVSVSTVYPSYVQTNLFSGPKFKKWKPSQISATFLSPAITSEQAAESILKGLRKKRSKIIFPFTGRCLYFLSNWAPWITSIFQAQLLKKFRRHQPQED